ncbi:MAG: hypothetical protein FWC73_11130 [Defluviitaleaceae bacterium]|nr:hypothetical protein [Defluviitaleaceae bacterium]
MVAIRNKAIEYINELPEERLVSALNYLRFLGEQTHPLEITSKEVLYRKIDNGLEDVAHGRVRPFDDVMEEIIAGLQTEIEES